MLKSSRAALAASIFLAAVEAQYVEQVPPLTGNGISGSANQGHSSALSADGNTMLTGAPADNSGNGAAWVFVRNAGAWTQQGGKLAGNGAVGAAAQQGAAVALSADGNTAVIGGPGDNNGAGAVWVFTRSGGVWNQSGFKLAVGDAIGNAGLGSSVAVSADGSTIIAGGPGDSNGMGAAWVLFPSNPLLAAPVHIPIKLTGVGALGNAKQGYSVAISGDGNTAFVGGPGDNGQAGAVWAFTRNGSVWTQQGAKLAGSGGAGAAQQGFAVALSADGNTGAIGGPGDNSDTGALWVFTRTGGIWTQQGSKLLGNTVSTGIQQGASVALTADGNLAIAGAPGLTQGMNAQSVGTAFVYARAAGAWTQRAQLGSGYATGSALQGASVAASSTGGTVVVGGPGQTTGGNPTGAVFVFILQQPRDFNADGRTDALLYDPGTGTAYTALSNGDGTYQYVYNLFTSSFDTLRACDFNGDLKADLTLYNSHGGPAYLGLGNGDGTFSFQSLFWSPGYDGVECGAFAPHGASDVLLYNSSTGAMWLGELPNDGQPFTFWTGNPGPGFTITKPAFLMDFSFSSLHLASFVKNESFLYNRSNGTIYFAFPVPDQFTIGFHSPSGDPGPRISSGYDFVDVADINGDGYADVIVYNSSNGNAATGLSDGKGGITFTPHLYSPGFTSVRLADYTGDGKADVTLYNKNTGIAYIGIGDGTGNFAFQSLFWSPGYDNVAVQDVNGDARPDVLLYNSATGTLYTGISNGDGTFQYTYSYWGPGKALAR